MVSLGHEVKGRRYLRELPRPRIIDLLPAPFQGDDLKQPPRFEVLQHIIDRARRISKVLVLFADKIFPHD